MSTAPPGGNTTIRRTGRSGYFWACAGDQQANASIAHSMRPTSNLMNSPSLLRRIIARSALAAHPSGAAAAAGPARWRERCLLRLHQRLLEQGAQLDKIRLADRAADDHAALVYQERGGCKLHIAERAGKLAAYVQHHFERQRIALAVMDHVIGTVVAHGNEDRFETSDVVRAVQFDHLRHFMHARRAIGSPEVDQHHFAAQVGGGE